MTKLRYLRRSTNDISTFEQKDSDWDEDVLSVLYANDSAFVTFSGKAANAARKMQHPLDLLPEWRNRWRMSINIDKSTIYIGHIRSQPKLEPHGHV